MTFWRWSTMKSESDASTINATMMTRTTPRLRLISGIPCFWRDASSARFPVPAAEGVAAPRRRRLLRGRRLGRLRSLGGRRSRQLHDLVERQVQEVVAALLVDENL